MNLYLIQLVANRQYHISAHFSFLNTFVVLVSTNKYECFNPKRQMKLDRLAKGTSFCQSLQY